MSGTGMQSTVEDEYLREMFSMFDHNGDGSISVGELGKLMRVMNCNPSDTEVKETVKMLDKDNSGKIEWSEFKPYISKVLQKNKSEQDIENAFKVFDKNGDGYVCASELKKILTELGQKLSDAEVDEMISVADMDKDGRINIKEFTSFICQPIH